MSLECSECERDLRGGHDPSCSRYNPKPRQEYLARWLDAIVEDLESERCPQAITDHIKKHFGPDLDKHLAEVERTGRTDWLVWFASASNLLEIYRRMCELNPARGEWVEARLARLQVKYDRNPETHTPPPPTEETEV
jgi:hypothetical protein